MSADPGRLKLYRLIAEKIAERADGFMQEITAAPVEVPASDSPEFAAFCLDQEVAADQWVSVMVDDCVQLLRAHNRLGAPKLWQSLYAISKGIIAHHLQELLHAAFHITKTDIRMIERLCHRSGSAAVSDFMRSDGEGGRVFKTAKIERAFFIACDKTVAVRKIIDKQLGADRELAFGTSSAPKFDMPSTQQINTTTAQPGTRESIGRYRVSKILQAETEIANLRPRIASSVDYEREKGEHPDYITIKAAELDPALKELLIGIKGHTQKKALRFAKQIAAAECNVKLTTIETAWDFHKPDYRRAPKKTALARSPAPRKLRHKK